MSADAIVSTALSLAGLSCGDPATQRRYVELLYPFDREVDRLQMGRVQSSCGLTCEAVLRIAEVDGRFPWRGQLKDWLRTPYAARLRESRYAVSLQVQLAHARGLWLSPGQDGAELQPGDMYLVGSGASAGWGGVEHVATVTGVDDDQLEVVEGGQIDLRTGHSTAIKRNQKRLRILGKEWWIGPLLGAGLGRRVQGWCRAGDLPCLPSGASGG